MLICKIIFLFIIIFIYFSFGFFSYILFLEIFMISIILLKFFKKKFFSSINAIILLILGACEIALGLILLVIKIRQGRLDHIKIIKCEGF